MCGRTYEGGVEQDPEVVSTVQGTPDAPHQRVNVAHFSPEVGPLQEVPSGGRGNPNTSATGYYRGWYPGMEEDFRVSD